MLALAAVAVACPASATARPAPARASGEGLAGAGTVVAAAPGWPASSLPILVQEATAKNGNIEQVIAYAGRRPCDLGAVRA